MEKQRFDYIDIARGLGILMVVWAHIMVTGWTHRMIYAFHMPLFFFLSGMMFKKEKYASFIDFFAHRAKRLLIPYVIYSLATWAFWAVFRYVRHDEVESYLMPLLQTFISQGSGSFMVHNSALWFIPCLFLTEIFYFFLCKSGRMWCMVLCFGCPTLSFLLGNAFGGSYWFTPPWNADAALIALPFYAVGNLLIAEIGHARLAARVAGGKSIAFFVLLCATALLCWTSMSFGECSMGSSSYQCSGWIFISRAFLGIFCLVLFSLIIGNLHSVNRFVKSIIDYFKWAGKKSLDIMCLHIPLKGICMIAVALVAKVTVGSVSENYLYSTVAFALTMAASWIIIMMIDRFLKFKTRICETNEYPDI